MEICKKWAFSIVVEMKNVVTSNLRGQNQVLKKRCRDMINIVEEDRKVGIIAAAIKHNERYRKEGLEYNPDSRMMKKGLS